MMFKASQKKDYYRGEGRGRRGEDGWEVRGAEGRGN